MTFKAPADTSIYKQESKSGSYVIPFAPELIDFILENKKLKTYRYGKKYDYLKIGDTVSIQNSATKEIVATAAIVNKSQTTFAGLPLEDSAHEPYEDKEHQRRVLSGYYAYIGRPLEDEDEFLIFDFKTIDQ